MISVLIYVINNNALFSAHVKFYTMNVELGSRLRRAGRSFVEGIRDIERGHTLQDEARARRITLYPNTVSVSDIENYKKSELDSVFLVARTSTFIP